MKLTTTTALVAAAVSTLCVAGASAQNLLVNPGFELDDTTVETPGATGWTTFNATYTNQALPNSGANALKMFGAVSGAFQQVPILPGQIANGEAVVANPAFDALANDQVAAINLEFYDVGGVRIGDILSNIVLDATSPADSQYTLGQISAEAPAGASTVRFVLVTGSFEDRNNDGVVTGGGAPFYDDAALSITTAAVPEPTSLALLGLGGLAALRRRRA